MAATDARNMKARRVADVRRRRLLRRFQVEDLVWLFTWVARILRLPTAYNGFGVQRMRASLQVHWPIATPSAAVPMHHRARATAVSQRSNRYAGLRRDTPGDPGRRSERANSQRCWPRRRRRPDAPGRIRPERSAAWRAPIVISAEMIGCISVELYTSMARSGRFQVKGLRDS